MMKQNWLELEHKTFIVTGGASGIGRAIVEELLADGANVAACDMNPKAPEYQNGTPLYIPTNVTDRASVDAMVEKTVAHFGGLDGIVNNAGITKDGLMLRMKDEDFDRVIQTNLRGAFVCVREAAKIMTRQRHGRIINISSVVGQMGNAGQINYASAKAGLIGLTKSAAKELAGRNVTVNAVAPGFVETDMTASLPDDVRAAYIDAIPLKRLGTPQDIADAVAFLASPGAGYITGQVIAVNGGMYC